MGAKEIEGKFPDLEEVAKQGKTCVGIIKEKDGNMVFINGKSEDLVDIMLRTVARIITETGDHIDAMRAQYALASYYHKMVTSEEEPKEPIAEEAGEAIQ